MSDLLVPFTLRLPDASEHDCAVSQGTPLSEALDSIGIDPSWAQLCRTSGGPVALVDRVGFEIPAGDVVVLLTSPAGGLSPGVWPFGPGGASGPGPAQDHRVSAMAALVSSALVVVLTEFFILAGPFLWGWQPSPFVRLAVGSLCVGYALVLGYAAPLWARTECVAVASVVFALACLQIVPADNPVGAAVAPIVVAWSGLLYCLSYAVRRIPGVEDAIAVPCAAWACAAAYTTVAVLGNDLLVRPSFLFIAVGASLAWVSPQLTMRASSFVLIDVREVLTVALPSRKQDPPRPKAMNARSSHEAYTSARVRSHVVIAMACAMCLCGGLAAGPFLDIHTWQGRAAVATVAAGAGALAFSARSRQRSGERVLMVVSSAVLLAVVGTSPSVTADFPGGAVGLLAACGTALALVFGLRGASGEGASSPFFGRVLDVFQGLTLIVALPSAVYASGLFDAVRQLAA